MTTIDTISCAVVETVNRLTWHQVGAAFLAGVITTLVLLWALDL